MTQELVDAERSARVNFLLNKNEELLQDIIEGERFKKDRIKRLAENCKELIALGELKIEVKDVAKSIIKLFKERSIDIDRSTVYRSVPDDCKNDYEAKDELESSEKVANATLLNDLLDMTIQEMDKMDAEHQISANITLRNLERNIKQKRAYLEQKISIEPRAENSIHTPELEHQVTKSYDAMGNLITIMEGVQDKLYRYPPEHTEDQNLAEAIDAFSDVFKPFGDRKYTKSMPDWFGVHLGEIPPNSILPDGGKRKLTSKATRKNREEILTRARRFCEAMPIMKRLAAWHRGLVEPRVAERKVLKHDDLSEKAFTNVAYLENAS